MGYYLPVPALLLLGWLMLEGELVRGLCLAGLLAYLAASVGVAAWTRQAQWLIMPAFVLLAWGVGSEMKRSFR